MTEALLPYGPAVVAMAVGCYELRLARGRRAAPSVRWLCLFALFLGAAMAVLAPATVAVADHALPELSHLTHLLGRELEMAALSFLPLAVLELGLPQRWLVRRSTHLRVTTATLVSSPAIFLAADADVTDEGMVTADGTGWIALAVFGVVFTAYGLWCLAAFILPVHFYARGLGPGPLRTGLRLITVSAGIGLLWGAWGLTGIANMVMSHRQGAGQDPVAVALGTGCLVAAALGATAAKWAAGAASLRRRLRAHRDYRALAALWSALHAVLPETSLPVRSWPGPGLVLLRDAEFALYRRVVEIRDGYLALRPYLSPHIDSWTSTAQRRFPLPRSGVAVAVEAATIAAALESARSGNRYGTGQSAAHAGSPVGSTVEAETAWLTRVAEAFEFSDLVEYVRCRARQELAGSQVGTGVGTGAGDAGTAEAVPV
jgi:hypothetical protein